MTVPQTREECSTNPSGASWSEWEDMKEETETSPSGASRSSSSDQDDLDKSDPSIKTKKKKTKKRNQNASIGLDTPTTRTISDSQHPQEQQMRRHYSVTELVETLGDHNSTLALPPELERRVLDFRMAQTRRREKYGEQKRWGIFGMYAHLSNVRIDLEWAEDAAWRRRHQMPYLSWSDFDEAQQWNRSQPWFTIFLICVCTLMLLVEFGMNDWKVESLKTNPLVGPSFDTLLRAGARATNKIVEEGQWFRLFTPIILHAGLVHYAINMLALWFIGAAVEQTHGMVNALVLFLIPGVGGNILSAIFLPQYISVGASGGIFGLIGGCIADISLNWKLLFIKTGHDDEHTARQNFMAIFWLFLDIVINIVVGLTPLVDNFTHFGGLVYGLCCGLSTIEPLAIGFFGVNATPLTKARVICLRFFGLIFSVVSIMITTAWLATANPGDTPCSVCRYVSCVPFPFFQEDKWWYCDDCHTVTGDLTKSGAYYERVDLYCPNDDVEVIDVSGQFISEKEEIQRRLPDYCREFCSDVFS